MIKLLIISGLLFNHSDTLIKQCTTDSCKKTFIKDLVVHFENTFTVVTIDSCGQKWEEVVPLFVFYNYYVRKMKMGFMGYTTFVTDDLYNNPSFDRCQDSIIKGWKLDKKKLKKLNRMPIGKVLKKYFDKNKYLKYEYENYNYEMVYYCYKRWIKVTTDFTHSRPLHYVL